MVQRTVSEWSQSELRSDKKPSERAFQVNKIQDQVTCKL